MAQRVEINGVGIVEFPDDMSGEAITSAIESDILPNADMANPHPDAVSAAPHLFPNINRGSFTAGLGSTTDRLRRLPEAFGAAVGRDQGSLNDLNSQLTADAQSNPHRATLDDVTNSWDKGNYGEAAGTLFGDVLPQTLGESLPDMGIMGAGAVTGALAAAPIPIPGARVVGAIAGATIAGFPSFFGMNVERQVQEGEITDPNQIESGKAAGAAVGQAALESIIAPILGWLPGVKGLAAKEVSALMKAGVAKLTRKDMASTVAKYAIAGGAEEAVTETAQQALERWQAGLEISPSDEQALKEYIESAVLGGLLGVGFGGVTGGVNHVSTSKDLSKTYDLIDQKNEEQAQRKAGEARERAMEAGAIPRPDAPLQITARPELQLSPTNGDATTSGTASVQKRLNATEGEFYQRNDQRLFDEAMDPDQKGYTDAQRETLDLARIARESLTSDRYTPAELNEVAPAIAQAVTERPASQGEYTVEQNDYSIEDLEQIAQNHAMVGQAPEIIAEELQKLRKLRRPVTELYNSITPQDIIELAAQKNIKTGTKSFDALVRHITEAPNLEEASPFRLTRMKETLNALPDGAFKGEPRDLINVREQNYSHEDFIKAAQFVLNNKSKSGKPNFSLTKLSEQMAHLEPDVLKEIRSEMERIGLIRKVKSGHYVVDNELVRDEFVPSGKPIPAARPIAAMNNKHNFDVEERTVAAKDEKGLIKRDENGRPIKEIGYHVVARPKNPDASDAHYEETISVHNNRAEAEANARIYSKAPSKVTKRITNPATGRDKNTRVPTTTADLRGMAVDPQIYAGMVNNVTIDGPTPSVKLSNVIAALRDINTRRGLLRAGMSMDVVNSVTDALEAKGVQGSKDGGVTEGAYWRKVIYLGLDMALDRIIPGSPTSTHEAQVIQNLSDVLSHEFIHALRATKNPILSDGDFKILVRMANTKTRPKKYQRQNTEGAVKWTYMDEVSRSHEGLSKAELEEEAVAEMFRDWAKDPKSIAGKPASLFRRIVKFLLNLGNFFHKQGVRSVNDIFGEIDSGAMVGDRVVGEDGAGAKSSVAKFSKAPPIDTPEFKKWFKNSEIVNEDGTPRQVYHGTKRTFTEFKPGYADGMMFFTFDPEFAGNWPVGNGGLREASAEVKAASVELRAGEKAAFNKAYAEAGGVLGEAYNDAAGDAAQLAANAYNKENAAPFRNAYDVEDSAGIQVIPTYLSVQKLFDPRRDYAEVEAMLARMGDGMDNLIAQGKHKVGNWIIYEREDVTNRLKELGYDGILLSESSYDPQHETIAIWDNKQVKSVFNQDFDANDPKFSIDRPIMKRYAVDVRRAGKPTIVRYFFAENDNAARALAASSPAINRDSLGTNNVRVDDPSWDADTSAPKFSVRRWRRSLDEQQYQDATTFVPVRPSKQNEAWDENTRGLALLDGTDPLPVVLLKGTHTRDGNGFGRDYILANSARFGGQREMGTKLEELLAHSHERGNPAYQVSKYEPENPAERSDLDYELTWKDPKDGQTYVLGLEKYTRDRVKYAAITTFAPQDVVEQRDAGPAATEEDLLAYRAQRDAAKYSRAPKQSAWTSQYSTPEGAATVPEVTRLKNGNWNGGPKGSPMTPRQVKQIVDRLIKMALSERAVYATSKDWYENAGRVIDKLSHGDPQIKEDMLRIVAYLSADNSLGGNIAGAIDTAFDIAQNGQVTVGKGRYPAVMLERIPEILGAKDFDHNLMGVSDKVMSFYRNLRDPAYGTQDFSGEVTLDKWMFRAFGYKGTSFQFKEGQYGFGKMVMERVAAQLSAELGVEILPRQAQAMVWTAQRNQNVDPVNATMVGFEHYFDRQDAVVTWEANPSVRTNLLPELGDQPMPVQREFARQAYELITANGQDLVLHKIGGQALYAAMPGTGTFEGAVSPNITTHIMMPRSADKTYDTTAADLYANAIGAIMEQDAVPWHRADPTLKPNNSNIGLSMMIDGEIDLTDLYGYLRTHAPSSEFSLVPRLDGKTEVRIINFAGMKEKAYVASIRTVLNHYKTDATFTAEVFRSTGNYLEGGKDGQGYIQGIREAGRADLLEWVADRRKAFHQLAKDWKGKLASADAGHSGRNGESAGRERERTLEVPRVEDDGTVLLHHWSHAEGIKNTLPNRYGTGFDGEEMQRKRGYPNLWEDRSYFGMNVGHDGGYVKEGGIGDVEYTSAVPYDKIYDWSKDPDGFRAKVADKWTQGSRKVVNQQGLITEVESMIKGAGYWGYWTKSHTGLNYASFRKMQVTPVKKGKPLADAPHSKEDAPKLSIAAPVESEAFKKWFAGADPLVQNENGEPHTFYFGAAPRKEFDTLHMGHNSTATFVSFAAEFASKWARAEGYSRNTPPRVYPVYLSLKKPFDFRDKRNVPLVEEYLLDKYGYKSTWYKTHMEEIFKGDWTRIEHPEFVEDFLKKNGFDSFTVIESSYEPIGPDNPVNLGVFNRDDLKSIFNEDFDRADPKFSRSNTVDPALTPENKPFLDLFFGVKSTVGQRIQNELRRQFSPGGLLPEMAHQLKLWRDAQFTKGDDIVYRTLAMIDAAAKSGYEGKRFVNLTPAQKLEVSKALDGTGPFDTLPMDMQTAVKKMRMDIDSQTDDYTRALQKEINKLKAEAAQLLSSGDPRNAVLAENQAARAEALANLIQSNKGKYVNRSYKLFDDPHWHKKIPRDVADAALNYLIRQYGNRKQAEDTFFLLTKGAGTAFDSMEALIKESSLGAKDLTILMKRKEIAPEIRALMGEHTDPMHNYARTMLKMTRLIWNTEFLDRLLEGGNGVFMWHASDPNKPSEATAQLAGANSKVLTPLNDMYATPEIAQAFKDALGEGTLPDWMNKIIGANGIIKAGKILYSPPTQIRNVVSATFFGIQGGSLDLKHAIPAANVVWQQIIAKEGSAAAAYRYYVDLGVNHDSPNAAMVQDLMEQGGTLLKAFEYQMESALGVNAVEPVVAGAKKFHTLVSNLYRGGDDIWKIIIFESQLAQYMKAKNMTRQQAERIVAKRVRDTVPTYSQTGLAMRNLGRFPFAGPFVAFSSEIIRTSYNNLKLIQSDLADPDLRGLAYRRIAGTLFVHSWAAAGMAASASMMGLSDDDEESVRKIGTGPWGVNSDYWFLGRDENGQLRYLDLSFADPYNLFHKAYTALMRNQPWEDKFLGAAEEVFGPFYQPDIAASAIYEVATNRRMRSGAPIYNVDAPAGDRAMEIIKHLTMQFGPGIFAPTDKIVKAWTGQRNQYTGRVYNLTDEVEGMFGLRINTFDPKLSLNYRISEFNESIANSRSYLNKVVTDINPVSEQDMVDAYDQSDKIRVRAYNDMLEMVNAAKNAGLSDHDVRQVLALHQVPKRYISAMVNGDPAPHIPVPPRFLRSAMKSARLLKDQRAVDDLRARARFVRAYARTQRQ